MIEAIAVALGVAYILLAIRQHRACWIAGGASTALYSVVFVQAGLPLQAALQLLYVGLSAYGWIQWRPGGEAPARPASWPLSRQLLALAAIAVATAISATLLRRFGWSEAPFADSLGTWASVVATWLLARRYIETWLWWIIIDTGLAALFASQGLAFTAALYLAYAVLAVAGWRAWGGSRIEDDEKYIAEVVAELGLDHPERTPLAGGLANRTIRLRDAHQDVVLRRAGDEAPLLGADRDSERTMQQLAAGIGLAPEILIARPADGLLVTRHVTGRELTRNDLHDVSLLRRIGAWVARLHALEPPPSLPVVDIGARAAGYLARMLAIDASSPAAAIADRRPGGAPRCRNRPELRPVITTCTAATSSTRQGACWRSTGNTRAPATLPRTSHPASAITDSGRASSMPCWPAMVPMRGRFVSGSRRSHGYSIVSGTDGMAPRRPPGSASTQRNRRCSKRGCSGERLHGRGRFQQDARPMGEITVTDRDGGEHRVNAREGVSLMETLREFDYGVAAICGGMCSCATCHVYVAAPWLDKLPPMQGDEKEILQELESYRPQGSRLSCQIPFEADLAGLEVEIAPEE